MFSIFFCFFIFHKFFLPFWFFFLGLGVLALPPWGWRLTLPFLGWGLAFVLGVRVGPSFTGSWLALRVGVCQGPTQKRGKATPSQRKGRGGAR